MHTLSPQTETYMYGTVIPGMTLVRLSVHKVTLVLQVQPVRKVSLDQQVLSVRLQLMTQLLQLLLKQVMLGLTPLMARSTFTTIHIGLRLVPHLWDQPDHKVLLVQRVLQVQSPDLPDQQVRQDHVDFLEQQVQPDQQARTQQSLDQQDLPVQLDQQDLPVQLVLIHRLQDQQDQLDLPVQLAQLAQSVRLQLLQAQPAQQDQALQDQWVQPDQRVHAVRLFQTTLFHLSLQSKATPGSTLRTARSLSTTTTSGLRLEHQSLVEQQVQQDLTAR